MRKTTREQIAGLLADGMTVSEIARQTEIPQPTIWRLSRGVHEYATERVSLAVDALHSQRFPVADEQAV